MRGEADAELPKKRWLRNSCWNGSERRTPWFIAVHLFGDGPSLHVRTVLENPGSRTGVCVLGEPTRTRPQRNGQGQKSGAATGYVEFVEVMPMTAGHLASRHSGRFQRQASTSLLVGPREQERRSLRGATRVCTQALAGSRRLSTPTSPTARSIPHRRGMTGHPAAVPYVVFHPSCYV